MIRSFAFELKFVMINVRTVTDNELSNDIGKVDLPVCAGMVLYNRFAGS